MKQNQLPKSPFNRDEEIQLPAIPTFKKRDDYRTTVRLTKEQFEILKKLKERLGISMPSLLRNSFFKSGGSPNVIPKSDTIKLLKELNRIGNNINQISRHLNSGVSFDWHPEFKNVSTQLMEIMRLLISLGAK